MEGCEVVDLRDYKRVKKGNVLIARDIDDSPLMDCPPVVREVFFYLVRKVFYKNNKKFNRGQGFFKISQIRQDLSWHQGNSTRYYNYKQIHRALKILVALQSITTMKGKAGLVITIINYDYYQTPDTYNKSNTKNTNPCDSERDILTTPNGIFENDITNCNYKHKTTTIKSERDKKISPCDSERENSYINRELSNNNNNKRIADFDKKNACDPDKIIETDSDESATQEFYLSKSGKKLTGKRLETFYQFWDSFDFKQGKAAAADSWLKIPTLTNGLVKQILDAAKIEAQRRQSIINKGGTPKWAQGWITERRWEDEIYNKSKSVTGHESKREMKNEIKDVLS